MPVIEVLFDDLQNLVGAALPKDAFKLTDILSYVKGEVNSIEGNQLSIEIKDGNRPDLWSVEGIARDLRGVLGIEEGLVNYSVEDFSGVWIDVDLSLNNIRPYIACSVVKQVQLSNDIIRGLMHLQDKIDQTYGRKRRRVSIGLYNFGLITPPLKYCVAKPQKVSFVPLEEKSKMNLKEIIENHPKGIEYGHIIKNHEVWPVLIDSKDKVLSFPPIVNSNDLGKITQETKELFVEVTGSDYQTVLTALSIISLSLAERNGRIFSTEIHYPYGERRKVFTPKLATRVMNLNTHYVNRVLGLSLPKRSILKLLKRARFNARHSGKDLIEVTIPSYRMDVMHSLDLIEDIAITFGYNNIQPRWPQQITFGKISNREAFLDLTREVMISLGFQEILSFSLINKELLFRRMNLRKEKIVEIFNPSSSRFTCVRSWLIPSLVDFLSKNTHYDYPQKVFEVGACAVLDNSCETGVREIQKLACLIANSDSNFSKGKAVFDAFSLNMGFKYRLVDGSHKSFISGRVGNIVLRRKKSGIIGEIHPLVLENWGVENPVTGFEVNLSMLMDLI